METIVQDIRYGLRMLRKSPGFATVAVLTLALGIGANTAIFSVLDAVLLRPLPYRDPSSLVWVSKYLPRFKSAIVGTPDYVAWRNHSHSFSGLAAYDEQDFNLTGGRYPERVHGGHASASLFSVLGAQPELGRTFREVEEHPASTSVVILSHAFWQRRFGGDHSVIGRSIKLDDQACEVVGVMPPEFVFPTKGPQPELLVPLSVPEHLALDAPIQIVTIVGHLARGVTPAQVEAELPTIDAGYPRAAGDSGAGNQIQVVGLQEHLVGNTRPVLLVMVGAVVLLLLVACFNTANLQLAKATARGSELAVRTALGASRRRLGRQLLAESILISLFGGGAGTLLAMWSIYALEQMHPLGLPEFVHLNLDYHVLGFTFAVAVTTGILSGFAPALFAYRSDVNEIMKVGAQSHTEPRGLQLIRKLLVVSEVSLAAVLLIGSGLLVHSFVGLLNVDPGFDPHRLLTLRVALPDSRYPDAVQRRNFFRNLVQKLGTLPGVTHAGVASDLPLTGFYTRASSVVFEGRSVPPQGMRPMVPIESISPGYLDTIAARLIAGRDFDSADTPSSPGTVIVNRAFCSHFFADEDHPLGKRVQLGNEESWRTIVGIVGDLRQMGLQTEASPEVFIPLEQDSRSQMFVALRTAVNPWDLVLAVRQTVSALDKEQPTFDTATMEERLTGSLAAQRWNMWLLAAFAGTALALAGAGIYGVMSYFVVRRTHEIGVRMALGASPESILALVIRQGAVMVILGGVIGIIASLELTRFVVGIIYGIRVTDLITYGGVSGLLAVVALLACYLPARRATRIEPTVALHYE